MHYSYYSISDHVKQINSFSEIQAKAFFQLTIKPNLFHIVVHPVWRFIRDYFLKFGFLDGFYGFVICINSAQETFLKYIKLRNIWRNYNINNYKICFINSLKTWGGGEKEHLDLISRINQKQHKIIAFANKSGIIRIPRSLITCSASGLVGPFAPSAIIFTCGLIFCTFSIVI